MLIYKKILLESNNSGSAGVEERLDQRQERRDYKEKIKDLKKEISELTDRKHNNDEIESSVLDNDNALTEGFSDALKNADRGTINDLVKKLEEAVRKINLDGEVKDDVKKSASNLCDQLKSIQVNRIFDDFKKMIESGDLKDLNSFKDDEITILRNGIGSNSIPEKPVLELYNAMNTDGARHFRHTDKRYYTDIKSTIERRYFDGSANTEDNKDGIQRRIDEIGQQELDTLFPSDITSDGLKSLANTYAGVTDWDGAELTDQTITLKDGESFTAEDFKTKFNTVNQARIDKNNRIVNGLDITLPDNFNTEKFQLDSEGNLKYTDTEQRDVTAADMLSSLNLPLEDVDFVDDNERDRVLQGKLGEFCDAVKVKLSQAAANNDNGESPTDASTETSEIKNCTLNERGFDLIDNVLGEENFIKNKDDKFEYDMNKLTGFLGSINSGNRREYRNLSRGQGRTVGSGKWKALHCAVQILLNKNEDANLNVNGQWIHSKRNPGRNAYYEAVYKFQTANSLKQDGIPGPDTIKKLLDNEQQTESGSGSASGDNRDNDNEGGNNNTPTVVEIANPGNLGLYEKVNLQDRDSLGIPEGKVYTKTDNSDDNGLYYQENNQLVRISTDDPWIRRTATMPSNWNNLPEVSSMAQTLNVCAKGAEKLNDIIKNHFQGYEFSVNDDKYEFKHNGNVVDLGNDFFENNLGESEITNKLQKKLNESQNPPS